MPFRGSLRGPLIEFHFGEGVRRSHKSQGVGIRACAAYAAVPVVFVSGSLGKGGGGMGGVGGSTSQSSRKSQHFPLVMRQDPTNIIKSPVIGAGCKEDFLAPWLLVNIIRTRKCRRYSYAAQFTWQLS